jgi:hypothetical protein
MWKIVDVEDCRCGRFLMRKVVDEVRELGAV